MAKLKKHTGWFVLGGAVFMLAGLMGGEVAELDSWAAVSNPAFFGKMIAHLGAVGAAWLAGKLMPQFGADA